MVEGVQAAFRASDLALIHNLCQMASTQKKDGQKIDSWSRCTGIFKKVFGRWLTEYEKFSVPIDPERKKAVWNLKPEQFT